MKEKGTPSMYKSTCKSFPFFPTYFRKQGGERQLHLAGNTIWGKELAFHVILIDKLSHTLERQAGPENIVDVSHRCVCYTFTLSFIQEHQAKMFLGLPPILVLALANTIQRWKYVTNEFYAL